MKMSQDREAKKEGKSKRKGNQEHQQGKREKTARLSNIISTARHSVHRGREGDSNMSH